MRKSMFNNNITYACCQNIRSIKTWSALGYPDKGPSYHVKDVVQGAVGNCYLLAALAATAWAAPTKLKTFPTYEFMNAETGAKSSVNLATKEVPLDVYGKPIYARLGVNNYTWPLLYEKAFAKWKPCAILGGDPDHPDISGLSGGASPAGLVNITRITNPVQNPVSSWGSEKVPNNSGVANVPAVAWTSGIASPPTGIIPYHTYALLGFFNEGSQEYVVMKNPCCSEPTAAIKASGVWNGLSWSDRSDGVFALKVQTFGQYFSGYAWVEERRR